MFSRNLSPTVQHGAGASNRLVLSITKVFFPGWTSHSSTSIGLHSFQSTSKAKSIRATPDHKKQNTARIFVSLVQSPKLVNWTNKNKFSRFACRFSLKLKSGFNQREPFCCGVLSLPFDHLRMGRWCLLPSSFTQQMMIRRKTVSASLWSFYSSWNSKKRTFTTQFRTT